MTAATEALETAAESKESKSEKAIDKKGTTGATLKRLTVVMASGENKGKFVLGTILRLIALIALVTLPFITGQAMNVINEGRWYSQYPPGHSFLLMIGLFLGCSLTGNQQESHMIFHN